MVQLLEPKRKVIKGYEWYEVHLRELCEQYARNDFAMRERVASQSTELRGTDRRVVGGEVRYYDTTDQYAIVSRQGKVMWFQVREDGDYRIN